MLLVSDRLPVFPLGTVLFPHVLLPLQVFEPRYREMMTDLMAGPEPWSFVVVAIREGHEVGADSVRSLYDVGCLALVRRAERLPDGRFALMLQGTKRCWLGELDHSRPYLQADVELLDDEHGDVGTVVEPADEVRRLFADYLGELRGAGASADLPDDPGALSFAVASLLVAALAERQALLEQHDTGERLRAESALLTRELALMRTLRTMPVNSPRLPPHSQN